MFVHMLYENSCFKAAYSFFIGYILQKIIACRICTCLERHLIGQFFCRQTLPRVYPKVNANRPKLNTNRPQVTESDLKMERNDRKWKESDQKFTDMDRK